MKTEKPDKYEIRMMVNNKKQDLKSFEFRNYMPIKAF